MTRLAFCADVHLGNHRRFGGAVRSSLNVRCRQALDVLSAAVAVAEEGECDALYILGDLFDRSDPLPQLITETIRALQTGTMKIVVLLGNHEQVSTDVEDHALMPLAFGGDNVDVVGGYPVAHGYGSGRSAIRVLAVPFQPGDARKWLPGVLKERLGSGDKKYKHTLLGLHLGVADDRTPSYLRGAHDAIEVEALAELAKEYGISHVFAGNWHDRKQWQLAWPDSAKPKLNHTLRILQLGALVPTGFDNPGLDGYGTVAVWDSAAPDKPKLVELPGPRFLKTDPEETLVVEPDIQLYTEAIVDTEAVKVAARSAAQAARSADTLTDALAKFVERMPLDEGVDRKTVLAKAKGYLS